MPAAALRSSSGSRRRATARSDASRADSSSVGSAATVTSPRAEGSCSRIARAAGAKSAARVPAASTTARQRASTPASASADASARSSRSLESSDSSASQRWSIASSRAPVSETSPGPPRSSAPATPLTRRTICVRSVRVSASIIARAAARAASAPTPPTSDHLTTAHPALGWGSRASTPSSGAATASSSSPRSAARAAAPYPPAALRSSTIAARSRVERSRDARLAALASSTSSPGVRALMSARRGELEADVPLGRDVGADELGDQGAALGLGGEGVHPAIGALQLPGLARGAVLQGADPPELELGEVGVPGGVLQVVPVAPPREPSGRVAGEVEPGLPAEGLDRRATDRLGDRGVALEHTDDGAHDLTSGQEAGGVEQGGQLVGVGGGKARGDRRGHGGRRDA
jgi:hypothetical protein